MFTALNKLSYVLMRPSFLHVPENTFFDIHLVLCFISYLWHKASCTLLCKQCSIHPDRCGHKHRCIEFIKKNLKIAQVSRHAILARMIGISAFPVILLYPSNPSILLIRKHFYLNLLLLGAKNAVFLFYSYVYGM